LAESTALAVADAAPELEPVLEMARAIKPDASDGRGTEITVTPTAEMLVVNAPVVSIVDFWPWKPMADNELALTPFGGVTFPEMLDGPTVVKVEL
jgi:hypothetical protein